MAVCVEESVRQNYHKDCEAKINELISVHFHATYTYISMVSYFQRGDVALPGFMKYFQKCSQEKFERCQLLISYQNKRGGTVVLSAIQPPTTGNWESGPKAMEEALALEKAVNGDVLELAALADTHSDHQLGDFVSSNFLTAQAGAVKERGDRLTALERVATKHGVYHFDLELC